MKHLPNNVKYMLKSMGIILIAHLFNIQIFHDSFKTSNVYFLYILSLITLGYTLLYYALVFAVSAIVSKTKIEFDMKFLLFGFPIIAHFLIISFFYMKSFDLI